MPLPENGSLWPPKPYQPAYRAIALEDAWYTGVGLDAIYSTTSPTNIGGGLWGQAKRFFWGTPTAGNESQRPNKTHIPVPAQISRMAATILYGEMPTVTVAEDTDDEATTPQSDRMNARLTEILDDAAHAQFLENGELSSAHGGAYLRVVWDKTLDPAKPFIDCVASDAAIPTFRWGRLSEVTFWYELPAKDGQAGVWRLLEHHTVGFIEYALFWAQTAGQLGIRVPLQDHPNTEAFATVVDANSQIETGSELLTAVYIPNVKPNSLMRQDPIGKDLGRSDYAGAESLFDQLDETITSWNRDLRLGKARVLIDKALLDVNGPGQGATFNADREYFTNFTGEALGSAVSGQQTPITPLQFAIRVQEHSDTAAWLLEQIFTSCGYSPQTFGYESAHSPRTVTATEVDSREHMTDLTRASKILYARPELQKLFAALMDVDQYAFGGPGRAGLMPSVEFADAATPSMDALATTLQLIAAAGAASTETLVEMLHPDWDQDKIDAEVELIKAEKSVTLPSLVPPDFGPVDDTGATDEPDTADTAA